MPRGGHNRLPDNIAAQRGTDRHKTKQPSPPARSDEPCKVPPPPKNMKGTLRRVWLELAAQVDARGTYSATDRTAFGLMVRCVAALEDAKDIAPTAYAHLQRAAAGWLARFGLTPADRSRAAPASMGHTDRFGSGDGVADPVEKFLFEDGRPQLAVVKGGRGG